MQFEILCVESLFFNDFQIIFPFSLISSLPHVNFLFVVYHSAGPTLSHFHLKWKSISKPTILRLNRDIVAHGSIFPDYTTQAIFASSGNFKKSPTIIRWFFEISLSIQKYTFETYYINIWLKIIILPPFDHLLS